MTAISDRTAATTTSTDKPATKPRPGALATSGRPAVRPPAAAHLSDEQVAELGRELDAIRDDILAKRGATDAAYIRRVIKIQRGLEISGRAALLMGRNKAAWVTGTSLLSLAKILENMEIGHNILHGQWDWMRDPDIHSTTWEWDFVTPARSWQHTHNDLHHRWTNVVGKDNDVGYNLLRMDEDQPWTPAPWAIRCTTPSSPRFSNGASRSTTWSSSTTRRARRARRP
jgi:fatty acid desaturase